MTERTDRLPLPAVPPKPTITRENPAFTAWVERRAIDLCTNPDAERPSHNAANGIPCFSHLSEARAEGLTYWRKRGDR